MAIAETHRDFLQTHQPETISFEGVDIQWEKSAWHFEGRGGEQTKIDTYSIWNTSFHSEIAGRLAKGETAALYLMGNYGVAQLRGPRGDASKDAMFKVIKKRDRTQSLAAFAHPSDIQEMIDYDRLPKVHAKLSDAKERLTLYVGPMHIILPIVEDNLPDLGEIRPEKSASFFWIPGHKGYESLYEHARMELDGGILGGGSLNEHGKNPSTTTANLKEAISNNPDWQKEIDFVIFDEIAESAGIGRSHTQVSFMEDPARVVRLGSVSPLKIRRETGVKVLVDYQNIKLASSDTVYDVTFNERSDMNVEIALARMARFQNYLDSRSKVSGPAI